MDKKTRGIAHAGLMTAGAVVSLALGRFLPTGQAGFAALASLFAAAAVIDRGAGYGIAVWICASSLGFVLFGASSAVFLFALFFGFYPAVKLSCEKRLSKKLAWILKALAFYIGGAACIFAVNAVTGLLDGYGAWIIPVGIILGGAAFVIFDLGYSKVILLYKTRVSK